MSAKYRVLVALAQSPAWSAGFLIGHKTGVLHAGLFLPQA